MLRIRTISTKRRQAIEDVFKETAISSVFEHVTKPTLIIAGEHGERITTLESKEVADLVKESQFDVYAQSSLYPFEEEKDKFIEDVTPFIKKYMPEH